MPCMLLSTTQQEAGAATKQTGMHAHKNTNAPATSSREDCTMASAAAANGDSARASRPEATHRSPTIACISASGSARRCWPFIQDSLVLSNTAQGRRQGRGGTGQEARAKSANNLADWRNPATVTFLAPVRKHTQTMLA